MRALIAAVACVLAWPGDAEACEPFVGVSAVFPDDEADLPANGIVVVRASSVGVAEFRFFVDDHAVETAVVERLSGLVGPPGWGEHIALRAVQLPTAGSVLELRRCEVASSCDVLGQWTLGEADDVPPLPPTRFQYDYVEHADCGSTTCSTFVTDRIGYVQVEAPEDEPRLVSILVRNTQQPSEQLYFRVTDDLSATAAFAFADEMSPGTTPDASVCIEVRVFDLAGNEAGHALESCAPCHVGVAPVPTECFRPNPEWTDAELFPGGECEGTPMDALPPLPAPLDPPTGSTGDSSSTGDGTTTGDAQSTGVGSGSGASGDSTSSSTPKPPQTTGVPDPSGGSATQAEPSSSSGDSGAPSASDNAGCRIGDSAPPMTWLLLCLGAGLRRRR